MIYKKILLKEITPFKLDGDATVEIYLNEKNKELNLEPRPSIIVLPGGGYEYCSQREAEPVAFRFLSEGFNVFLLKYTCNKAYPTPHLELAILMNYLNENYKELNIKENCISLVGFSAGGHLVSSYAYLYKELSKQYNLKLENLKPFSLILAYPVTFTKIGTQSKTKTIITNNDDQLLMEKLNVPSNISDDYPPTYVFTTKVDKCVDKVHTIEFINELKKKNIKIEYDIFDKGEHGGSLYNRGVYNLNYNFDDIKENRIWINNASDFIFKLIG